MSVDDRPDLYVARPDLPPLEELVPLLERIWRSRIVTNGGALHEEFERALARTLRVPHVSLFNNATTALLVALKEWMPAGEVITTPYSFVATSHALVWNGLEPVFVDVEPGTLNLDPARVEEAITPRTSGILAVHCYGVPCDVHAFASIARRHGLALVYDAAHAFGVEDAGGSILRHGDASIVSFHGTKVLTTLEGGAVVSGSAAAKEAIDRRKNFGFEGEAKVTAVGINGKMNEVQAAIGLLQLPHVEARRAQRRRLALRYRAGLEGIPGIRLHPEAKGVSENHAYFPIFVGAPLPPRDTVQVALRARGIHARRYFHPLIPAFPTYHHYPSADPTRLPVAAAAAASVLCLPLHTGMDDGDVDRVIDAIAGCT